MTEEQLLSNHTDDPDNDQIHHHGLSGVVTNTHRTTTRREPVVTPDKNDPDTDQHRATDRREKVRLGHERPEHRLIATRRYAVKEVDTEYVTGQEHQPEGHEQPERHHKQDRQNPGRDQVRHRADPHHLEGINLVTDTHRAQLSHQPATDLGGQRPTEQRRMRRVLTGRGEDRRVVRRTQLPQDVMPLERTLRGQRHHQDPDDHRTGQHQNPGLPDNLGQVIPQRERHQPQGLTGQNHRSAEVPNQLTPPRITPTTPNTRLHTTRLINASISLRN